ncbi:membrane protein [Halovibrio variabilis]|uniref:Membrane protein n=1 Tax=Halovibrio variabilis TaxID=31910 RepID=A0A511USQ9_9GAMM|nr:alpha/beta-hydrolase family protein [Halovibrio variabilis]GEN29630.1 membrane protein [Halovibrio variabilis]
MISKERQQLTYLFSRLSGVGLVLGTLLFAFSLTPSLLPRPLVAQGVVSGLSFTAGYALGVAFHWMWAYLHIPEPNARIERQIKRVAAVACAIIAGLFLWQAAEWQNSIRTLMAMAPANETRPFSIALIALVLFVFMLFIAYLFKRTFRLLSRKMAHFLPRRVAYVLGTIAAIALFWSVLEGVIFSLALQAADRSYQQVDELIQDDISPPNDPLKPGSAESMISWEALGSRGRRFVTRGPSGEEIGQFTGEKAPDPVRVYVGLSAAETPQERAQLALEELIRVGGFERSVLVLATPTGRGWVPPAAQDTVEYLQRGDIATIAAQYSYLPSHLSLIAEGEYGVENARALFTTVYDYWTSLPSDERPRLYLFGLSLGALNSDLSFDFYDIIEDPFHGALWSGPPFRSETWRAVTQDRDKGSPAWLPTFRDGAVVRFMNQYQELSAPETQWGDFRIAFLQYASDPITFFEPAAFWREPDWMREPRGPDVSPDLRWYPVVTMLQLLADLATGTAPPGFGHEIAAEDYIDAWAALVEPEGWNETELARLRAHFIQAREEHQAK